MKRDLRSMGKEKKGRQIGQEDVEWAKANVDQNTIDSVQSVLDQYGHKSEAELLNDLKSFQQMGIMDRAALYNVAEQLAPMLDYNQQQKLYAVMQELGKSE